MLVSSEEAHKVGKYSRTRRAVLCSLTIAALYALSQTAERTAHHSHVGHAQSGHSVPHLCSSGITKTASTGDWNTAGTWSPSGVPGAGARVSIPNGVTVTYDANSTSLIECIDLQGVLAFEDGGTRNLRIEDFNVRSNGYLEIGTEADPFTSSATIEFDGDLDTGTVGTPGADPEQFGVGLLVEGKIRVFGVQRTAFARLTAAVPSSAGTVTVASCPTGWANGDALFLPDSRQVALSALSTSGPVTGTYETFTMSACSSGTITLSGSTAIAHPCAVDKNSACVKYPHIANYTRNIVFQSVSPSGVRGHTMYVMTADVDMRHFALQDMGRTLNAVLNCTLYTTGTMDGSDHCTGGTGTLTRIGTNQAGRYPWHAHGLTGIANPGDTGYQWRVEGAAILSSKKWPLTFHMSVYGLMKDNVILFGDTGAGLMMEMTTVDGNAAIEPYENMVQGNFVCSINEGPNNTASPRSFGDWGRGSGRDGTAYYITNYNNRYVDNVGCNVHNDAEEIISGACFKGFVSPAAYTYRYPLARGLDYSSSSNYGTASTLDEYMHEHSGNECYGRTRSGMTFWHLGTDHAGDASQTESLIEDFTCWHITEECYFAYPSTQVTFDGMYMYGDPATRGGGTSLWDSGDYNNTTQIVRNFVAHNVTTAFGWSVNLHDLTVENGDIYAEVGLHFGSPASPGGGNQCAEPTRYYYTNIDNLPGLGSQVPVEVVWRNVAYTPLASCTQNEYLGAGGPTGCKEIVLQWMYGVYNNACPDVPFTMTVEDHLGNLGEDFNVYFNEQGANQGVETILAAANVRKTGDVVVWDGNANDALAPCTDTTTYPDIEGIVCNIVGGGGGGSGQPRRLRFRIAEWLEWFLKPPVVAASRDVTHRRLARQGGR